MSTFEAHLWRGEALAYKKALEEQKQKFQDIYDKIIKELQQTPCGADWSESHFRSLLSNIAQDLQRRNPKP